MIQTRAGWNSERVTPQPVSVQKSKNPKDPKIQDIHIPRYKHIHIRIEHDQKAEHSRIEVSNVSSIDNRRRRVDTPHQIR